MAFEFHLPDLAEGMAEAEVVAWKVKVGDPVVLDQPLVEVMSDKATVEIPSPRAGVVSKINFREGQICKVGEVLFVIDEAGAAAAASSAASAAAPSGGTAVRAPQAAPAHPHGNGNGNGHLGLTRERAPGAVAAAAAPRGPEIIDATGGRPRVLATPATRRLARQLGVELSRVTPTGSRGQVTSDDVRRAAAGGATASARPAAPSAPAAAARPAHAPLAIPPGEREERIPLRGMRKRIAENMTRSVSTAAHFTYVEEVDCTDLVAVRKRAVERAAERGVKLTYLPFIVKAVVAGLKKWPQLNASLDEAAQEIVRKGVYHIGIAAQGPQGLVVTVVRDADRRSILDIAAELERLARAVQEGKATREDLTGSTFTISSLGKLGGVLATPIINFPEVGILGVHEMKERPAVRDGQIVIRWLMNLSISLDHRLVDGWDGAMFLQEVKTLLEDPTLMFMEMV
ncbi:MAG TPA: dihydrolipoamide acetyltransferase family protein [Kofleriaceae bacterium]|nr:dihydrolipoamide acetyltransferase family protein [Kofleriaceae bacterium]